MLTFPSMKQMVVRTLVAGVVGAGLVACGGTNEDAETEAGRSVTVEHLAGTTVVEGTPERIVAVGQQWVDALLEFDVQPVGYISAGTTGDDRELYPWQSAVSADATMLDAASVVTMGGAVPVEEIASLEPDLILVGGIADPAPYEGLVDIAPTIFPKSAKVETWQSQIETLGDVLGREDDADAIIAEGEEFTDAISADYPGLQGKTAVLSQFVFDSQQLVVVADPEDGAAQIFDSIGLSVPQELVDSPDISGGRLVLSPERVDVLGADLVVMLPNGGTEADLLALPGFSELPAVAGGGLAVVDYATVVGINLPSKASIEYSLDRIRPQLEAVGA